MTSILGRSEIVGTWRPSDEDSRAVLTVSGKDLQHLHVREHDGSDGERFRLSDLKATQRTLEYRYWVPSTDWHAHQRFSLRPDGKLWSRLTISETWLPAVPYQSPADPAQMSPGARSRLRPPTKTFTIATFLADCDEKCNGLVGLWGEDDGCWWRLSVRKVRRNAMRVRLFDVFRQGKKARFWGALMTARTLHFDVPWATFHYVLQKDGTLCNRQTLFDTWVRE
jgi:hypothetical protein